MSRKIFITGITGFVGRHLVRELISLGGSIFGTAFPEKPGEWDLSPSEGVFFQDIRDDKGLSALVARIRPDWVFHLAAVSNVKHSWEKRRETLTTNLTGTLNLFEALREHSPRARALYVSSSDVYGVLSPVSEALSEEDAVKPVNPYAFTKIGGEILSQFYAQIEGLDLVIARPFPHTGPGQSPDFVCSDWACQIAQIEREHKKPAIKVGNIDAKRDFLDVRDVVKAYILLMERGEKGEVYNICSGNAVSLGDVLNRLLAFSSESIEVEVDPERVRKIDIPLLVGDNRKIKRATSWEPKISMSQSLEDLIQYWRDCFRY
ncbi:MAG: GDP-mannose 4,6-dehydratase [Candidatus Aminicenantes bacterium]|nr:GDP-mannose 4,6-dehydratase [Candidatus Aminicenantes bacterium]